MIGPLRGVFRRPGAWGWILVGAIVAYLLYLLVAGLLTPEAPTAPGSNLITMRGIVSEGQNGKSGWHFEASRSEVSPDGFTTSYHDVRNATFYREGRPSYRLMAALVSVDSRNQNYSATGGVRVWSTDKALPDDLRTDDAYWNQASQILTCPGPTSFLYRGTTMRTTHMTVNLQSGASQLGDTTIDYFKIPSPAPLVSAAPLPAAPLPTPIATPSPSP
ncbi:MAG TPA: LPS export ABC transporter periplasmic protein LptC [Candidatus Eremiobacteraceae bacterium]